MCVLCRHKCALKCCFRRRKRIALRCSRSSYHGFQRSGVCPCSPSEELGSWERDDGRRFISASAFFRRWRNCCAPMSSRVHNHDESRKEEEEASLSSAAQGAQELVARVSLQRFQKRNEGLQWASVAASSSSSHMRNVVSFVSGIRREVAGVGGKLGQFVEESKKKGRFVQFLVGRAKRVGDSSGRASYGSLVLPGLLNLGSLVEARVKNLGRIRSEIPEFVARAMRQLVEDQVSRGVPRPLFASLSSSAAAPLETKHLFDIAMGTEQVARRLDGVPVYTVSNSANEFVLVSDLNSSKSLGLFCFREADASALLAQVFLKPFL